MLTARRITRPNFTIVFTLWQRRRRAAGRVFGEGITHRPLLYVTILQSVAAAISGSSSFTLICGNEKGQEGNM